MWFEYLWFCLKTWINIIIENTNAIVDWSLCVETGHKCDTIKKTYKTEKTKNYFSRLGELVINTPIVVPLEVVVC